MKGTEYVISVDWLQVYARTTADTTIKNDVMLKGKHRSYCVRENDIQTAMFKNVATIYIGSLPCAIIQYNPRSTKLDNRMMLIKLENRVLYSAGYVELLYDVMNALKVVYKGITRLDIAYDCCAFKGNRSPSKFINNFVSKRGITAHNIRKKGSEEFTCHGTKPRGGEAKINYIRFGSPQSKISAYIYNKTQELKEVKDKPWIRDAWKKAGIINSDKDVFRSEISIKAEGMDIMDMATDKIFRLSPDYLDCQEKIEMIFRIYAEKYFCFLIDGGQKRKKDFKRIELFEDHQDYVIKPIRINTSADTGRIEKICYNVLDRLSEQYTDQSDAKRRSLSEAMLFLSELSGKKQMIINAERKETYLKSLKTKEFYSKMDIRIFEAWHQANEERKRLAGL